MSGKGWGLGFAAVLVGLLGVALVLGSLVYARTSYGGSTISSQSMLPTYSGLSGWAATKWCAAWARSRGSP
ncbi:hypothetical protein [Streptomyces hokutonensis]|uniref:hypothetical protein n=1 Tax=Streptomyces hokutonensis TaxID=1306990 RepID=UPI0033CB456F